MKMEIFIFERILLVQISPLPIFRHDTAYVFVHLLYQHVLTRPIRACVEAALARWQTAHSEPGSVSTSVRR